MLGLSYAIRLSPRIEKRLATLFNPSPSRVGHPGDPYKGCTNNVAEYEGLLLGLRKARALGARWLSIGFDSELITGHINKTNRALKPELSKYLAAVRSMERFFLGLSIRSFPRLQNKQADIIAKAAA